MKVLVMGGTGMIGGHAALMLAGEGHEVTLGARKPASPGSPVTHLPLVVGDYTRGDFAPRDLERFDAVVFAAGNDIRHLPSGADAAEFWRATQIDGVPGFMALAKTAGVRRVVQLGSYYHHVMPHLAGTDAYVHARKLADEGARALADADFNVSTLNPPSIVGAMPGVAARRYERLVAWARGDLPGIPDFAPAGGTNYMSVRSLGQAISGALRLAEPGRAYLVGDENLRFVEFFQMFFDAAGGGRRLAERDQEHPILPDAFIVPGRGTVLAYDPDPAEVALLDYGRGDVRRAVEEIVGMVAGGGAVTAALLDVVALRLVTDRYAMAVDRGDGPMFADQFTDDGLLISPRGRFQGRQSLSEVPAMMQDLYARTHHSVTGLVPVLDGDRAEAQTHALARHFFEAADGIEYCYEMAVRYQDAFRRDGAGWRLARRELFLVGDTTRPTGRRHTLKDGVWQ